MKINPYKTRRMEFLYSLVENHQQYMKPSEIAKQLNIEERTVIRRINKLREEIDDFGYYPSLKANNYGLANVVILCGGLKSERVKEIIPYRLYVDDLIDFKTIEKAYLIYFCLPPKYYHNFVKFWDHAVEKQIIRYYKIYKAGPTTALYAPFHEVVDRNGDLHFDRMRDENSPFIGLLEKNLNSDLKINFHKRIMEDPLMLPIIMELDKAPSYSSRLVWHSMKNKLGERIWDYIHDSRREYQKTDDHGMKYTQKLMRYFQSDFDSFFQQTRVVYPPFYIKHNGLYLILRLKKSENILELAKLMARKSLQLIVTPLQKREDKAVVFYMVTNGPMILQILKIIPEYIDPEYDNRALWLLYDESSVPGAVQEKQWHITRNYHHLFDPHKLRWKYEHDKYMETLENMN